MKGKDQVRLEVRSRLWSMADELDWLSLSSVDKNRHYDNWVKHPEIGGRLARVLDQGKIRSYIKDALMKVYCRERQADPQPLLLLAGIPHGTTWTHTFIKPPGCILDDGRVVCWGRADNWKVILVSIFERCHGRKNLSPFAVVLTQSAKHYESVDKRAVAEDVAKRLGGIRITWHLS